MPVAATLRDLQSQSAQQWLDRATRTLPQVIAAILVVAIAWQLVQFTWMLLEPAPQFDSSPIVASTTTSRPKGVDVQAIVSAKLFGTAQAANSAASGPAPQTQLPLVLTAVFAADQPNRGLAIIGESAQQAKVYKVGDAVRSGTRLHEVYADRVLLDRSGTLETLPLPRRNTGPMVTSRPPTPSSQAQQVAQDLRQLAANNPSALTDVVRPQPVFANGVQRGYRVYPGRNRQQFAKLGLHPGDLVLAINGTTLDDPQRGMEVFGTIGSSDRVQVTVERNGKSQELTLNMGQLHIPESTDNQGAAGRRGGPPSSSQTPQTQ